MYEYLHINIYSTLIEESQEQIDLILHSKRNKEFVYFPIAYYYYSLEITRIVLTNPYYQSQLYLKT